MKRVLATCLALLAVACGEPTQSPELQPFIVDFEEAYDVDIDFRVELADKGEHWSGECRIRPWEKRVLIDAEDWELISSYSAKRMLVFHELAHCEFWLKHDKGELETEEGETRPVSYMWAESPESQPAFHDPDLMDYYTEELRSRIYFVGKEGMWDGRGPD